MQTRALREVFHQGEALDEFDVEVRKLWVQEKVRRGELSIIKLRGEDNAADGLTENVDRSTLDKYMIECGFIFRDGRRELCPYLGDV